MSKRGKQILIGVGAILVALVVLRLAAGFLFPALNINDVRTGGTPEYPDLVAQRFHKPAADVYAAALATALDMDMQIAGQKPVSIGDGEIRAVATTMVFRFKDDVTIHVSMEGEFTTVNVHSKSRVGQGDFGTNARRIHDFQARLAARLQ